LKIDIRLIESPQDLGTVEDLQRLIWSGNDTEIVPVHLFRAAVHNGGLVIGAYVEEKLVGFVFGFIGIDDLGGQKRLIHASHMAGVHPEFRDAGLGYKLKRAQWQMVRAQGIDRITWTYDPLQSRNANLNIAKLGAVCSTYISNYYGEMRDELNMGMPSDRFQVDWWVNSNRVKKRMNKPGTNKNSLSHYMKADIPSINQTQINEIGFIEPVFREKSVPLSDLVMLEIPSNIQEIKDADIDLGIAWSDHVRSLFLDLFNMGYIVTDFIFLPGEPPRSYYILSNGDAVL